MKEYNVSIVIPTWNRCELVDRLLQSLAEAEKSYQYGKTEVLIVDSSEGSEKENIEKSCRKYGALYITGDDSVRKKRNKGILSAKYEYILFIDSDVTAQKDLINNHIQTFIENESDKLAGTFGLTEFVGTDNFVWKIIQYSTFLDSFQFAKKFPYQNWTIGNNVMFLKKVLLEVGLFEENFPYKLGADDLEMTYRITHSGYLIKSAPDAVTYHAKDTWKKWKAISERAKRWGSMEYYIRQRHPEIFITWLPKTEVIIPVSFLIFGIYALLSQSLYPMGIFLLFTIVLGLELWALDTYGSENKNIVCYFGAKWLESKYYYSHAWMGIKNRSISDAFACLSFSAMQTRFMLKRETRRMWMTMVTLVLAGLLCII